MDFLVELGAAAMRAWEALMAQPALGPAVRGVTFLTGTSGAFWFLSRVFGHLALRVHEILHEDLADLFALTYNVVLASLFGGVMALACYKKAGDDALFVLYQCFGFILVYLVLSAAYAGERGEVDPHSGAGFGGGIAAYLIGCVFPRWISGHPFVTRALDATRWVVASPVGKVALALSVLQGALYGARALRRWFFWKSVKVGKRRFFFEQGVLA